MVFMAFPQVEQATKLIAVAALLMLRCCTKLPLADVIRCESDVEPAAIGGGSLYKSEHNTIGSARVERDLLVAIGADTRTSLRFLASPVRRR